MKVNRWFRKLFRGNRSSRSRSGSSRLMRKLPKLRISSVANPFAKVTPYQSDTQRFLVILNWLGYVLLIVSAVDYFLILYPPQLTNPNWELQTFINMVNNSWLLLLALILIYIPNRTQVRRFELIFLRLLRWSLLLGAIVFLGLIPLTVVNANRINQNTTGEIARQQAIQQEQLNGAQAAIESGNVSPFQIQRIRQVLGVENIPESLTLQEALLQEIKDRKQELNQEAANQKRDRFRSLARQVTRNGLAGVLIAAFLMRLWWEARWVRAPKKDSRKSSKKSEAPSQQQPPQEPQAPSQQESE